jgi:hypothetical protein
MQRSMIFLLFGLFFQLVLPLCPPFSNIYSAFGQEGPLITCTADKPMVRVNQKIDISVWVPKRQLTDGILEWAPPTGGTILGNPPHSIWDFTGVGAGAYRATAILSRDSVEVGRCSVVVLVALETETKGAKLLTGRSLLVGNQSDVPKDGSEYGLYSYLILLNPPADDEREKYLIIIATFLRKSPEILELEAYGVPKSDLNIAYIPLDERPDQAFNKHVASKNFQAAAAWVLNHYNYNRAKVLVRWITKNGIRGPLIVSYPMPLGGQSALDEKHLLVQDYAEIPENLSLRLIQKFFDRAGQTSWSSNGLEAFAERVVIIFSVIAEGAGKAKDVVDDWVLWGANLKSRLMQ